ELLPELEGLPGAFLDHGGHSTGLALTAVPGTPTVRQHRVDSVSPSAGTPVRGKGCRGRRCPRAARSRRLLLVSRPVAGCCVAVALRGGDLHGCAVAQRRLR